MAVRSDTTMSRPTISGSSTALFNACICSSSSTARPVSSAVRFRNENAAAFRSATISLSSKREVLFGLVISQRRSNRWEVGFVKLGQLGQLGKRRRLGTVGSVRTDASAVVETEGAAEKSSEEKELIGKRLSLRCSSFEREAATSVNHLSEQRERQRGRRQALVTVLLVCTVPIVLTQMPGKLLAEEAKNEAANNDQSIVGGLLSLFDPNETTKQGKKLPKAYLKSAREVIQTLRASFSEDSKNDAKFRRNADSAKGAIRDYISNWRGAKLVDAEDSYQALERALRILSEFYSKKGPSAALPEDVRGRILDALQKADDAL